tara:strand:+ start:13077 stop:13256 length:180 start_codon:yes stop_codon:yes gene_type:complete
MKKLFGLFLLPLVGAHHEGTEQVVDVAQSTGNNFAVAIVIFLIVILGLAYYLMKGGSRK